MYSEGTAQINRSLPYIFFACTHLAHFCRSASGPRMYSLLCMILPGRLYLLHLVAYLPLKGPCIFCINTKIIHNTYNTIIQAVPLRIIEPWYSIDTVECCLVYSSADRMHRGCKEAPSGTVAPRDLLRPPNASILPERPCTE